MVNQPIQFVCNDATATDIVKVIKANTEIEVKNIGTIKTENYAGAVKIAAYSAAVSDSGYFAYTANAAVFKAIKDYSLVIKFGPVDPSNSMYSRANSIDGWKKVTIPFKGAASLTTADLTVAAINEAIKKACQSDVLVAVKDSSSNVAINLIAKCDGELEVMNMHELQILECVETLADGTMFAEPTVAIEGIISHTAKPAFGSYLSLLKSVRFPTEAHTAYGNPLSDGMPVRGREYSQIIIPFKVDRGPIGDSKFAENVVTVRNYVLWAEKTVAAAVKSELDKVLHA